MFAPLSQRSKAKSLSFGCLCFSKNGFVSRLNMSNGQEPRLSTACDGKILLMSGMTGIYTSHNFIN